MRNLLFLSVLGTLLFMTSACSDATDPMVVDIGDAPKALLTLQNCCSNTVSVVVDNNTSRTLKPSESLKIYLKTGDHKLLFKSSSGKAVYRSINMCEDCLMLIVSDFFDGDPQPVPNDG